MVGVEGSLVQDSLEALCPWARYFHLRGAQWFGGRLGVEWSLIWDPPEAPSWVLEQDTILCLVLVQPRKTGNIHDWNIVDWDVKPQYKQSLSFANFTAVCFFICCSVLIASIVNSVDPEQSDLSSYCLHASRYLSVVKVKNWSRWHQQTIDSATNRNKEFSANHLISVCFFSHFWEK